MKRALILTVGLVLLMASPGLAAVANSPHDMVNVWGAGAAQGICSYCHVPHSAQGARLWPSLPDAGIEADFGVVGSLCYTCHGFQNYSGANQDVTDTTFDILNTNHPLTTGGPYPNTDATGTGYPYTAAGSMECTSCHNVHQQTALSDATVGAGSDRNFLRSPYYVGPAAFVNAAGEGMFCTDCHQNRGISAQAAGNTLGTHPVGGTVVDGRSGTAATVNTADPLMSLVFGTDTLAPGDGAGGGHTTNTAGGAGGVACWTCHAPHGGETLQLAYSPYDANGTSVVCEMCHGVMPSLTDATDLAVSAHPVDANTGDDVSSGGNTLLILRPLADNLGNAAFPAYLNVLNAAEGPANQLVCLSCHGAHEADPGTPIFRAEKQSPGTGICDDCHSTVFVGRASHPVGVPLDNEDGGTWPNNDALPLTGVNMVCETCHSGHNGELAEPLLRVSDANSEICNGCHTDTLSTDPIFAVNAGAANPSAYISEATYSGTDFGAVGARLGTHSAYRTVRPTGAGADHQAWKIDISNSQIAGRYGADGDTIICQSCHTPHDADPVGGWGSNNILYRQNGAGGARTGVDGGGTGGTGGQQAGWDPTDDSICQGCHVPSGTHPVQAWTVSRTGAPLDPASAYVHAAGPTSPSDYSGGEMTCESCHSPHAALTATGSFILEAGTGTSIQSGGDRVADQNRDLLCALCHFY